MTRGPNRYDKPSVARRLLTSPYNVTKKTLGKVIDTYQLEDDIYKIMHFENTIKYLSKAFPERSLIEIEEMAAKRTRDLMPNYLIAPKVLKKLRNKPIGDFATFAAESTRVAKNLVAYTVEDALSGNPELMALAARRLGGMTIAGLGADVLQAKSQVMMGITDDEKEAAYIVGPSFNYNVPQFYLSPVENYKGRKIIRSVSSGSLDPFTFIKSAARFTHKILNDDDMSLEKIKNIRYEPELFKLGISMIDKTLAPFVGTSIITDAMVQSVKDVDEGNPGAAAYGIAEALFFPGIRKFIQNRAEFESQSGYIPEGERTKGQSDSLISTEYKGVPGQTDWKALLGFKVNLQDLSSSVKYNIGYDLSNINKNKKLSQLLKGKDNPMLKLKKLGRTFAGDRAVTTEQDLKNAKKADELRILRDEKRIRMYVKAYKTLGFSMEDIVKNLRNKNNIDILVNIGLNMHTPSKLSSTDIDNYQKKLKTLGINLPVEYFQKMDEATNGSKINEED